MQWVLTFALPLCALFASCGTSDVGLPTPEIQIGQCLDLLPHFPIGGASVTGPSGGSRFAFPCGDAPKSPGTARRDVR